MVNGAAAIDDELRLFDCSHGDKLEHCAKRQKGRGQKAKCKRQIRKDRTIAILQEEVPSGFEPLYELLQSSA